MKLKDVKPGQVFKYAGYEWIKLEQEGLALMSNILFKGRFDESCNNWRKSMLRKYLNKGFYETLMDSGADENDLETIETDLTSDDGLKNYEKSEELISLMTVDLYRSNRHLLKLLEICWWLATPHSCLPSSCIVRYVSPSGTLNNGQTFYDGYGVRPLIKLAQDVDVLLEDDNDGSVDDGIDHLTDLIENWAKDRGLDTADPAKQLNKLAEEVGELAGALIRQREDDIVDALGDIYAVITVLAMQLGLEIEDCISSAFDVYKNRQGKIVDGTFIKEEDLAKLDE